MTDRIVIRSLLTLSASLLVAVSTLSAHAEPAGIGEPIGSSAVLAVVSIRDQRISLYDADGAALRARVSSGRSDYETPVGVYSVLQKKEDHTSNLYDDAQMPFMQRITWSGIALHAGQLPGRPASHGCVRMPYAYSEQIFPLTRLGMRVVVAYNDVAPVPIEHPLLFQPEPVEQTAMATPIAYEPEGPSKVSAFEPDVSQWAARKALLDTLRPDALAKAAEAEAAKPRVDDLKAEKKTRSSDVAKNLKALKRAEAAKRKADQRAERGVRWLEQVRDGSARKKKSAEANVEKTAKAAAAAAEALSAAQAKYAESESELARVTTELAAAEAVKAAAVSASNEAKRKLLPVSVFVSLKAQRLYVRQGHEPVLDIPVTIAEPERPIGTFVYTAVGYDESGDTARWTVVSTGPRSDSDWGRDRRKSRRNADGTPPATDLAGATAALDRIKIGPDVAAKLSKYVWPGTSLIVSDEELSKETGESTDFVVLISGEPQGGIKTRPKRQPDDDYYYYYDEDGYYDYRRPSYERRRRPRYTPYFSFW